MTVVLALVLVSIGVGCGGDGSVTAGATETTATPPPLPRGGEPANLDPADFVARIDNPWWPMAPGSRWVYRETDSHATRQRVEVTVTERTKKILGIEATVVRDVVTEDGELVEVTDDWYAQDRWGNVWYLGEDTAEYEDGRIATRAGSWEAGVDGAEAGVVMPAAPKVGLRYRQEYYAGEAEDRGEVLSLAERVEVPYGSFERVLMTKDTTPLEPDIVEHKFYARGVGPVLALAVSGGGGREELLRFRRG
jgi:hypothetical protein